MVSAVLLPDHIHALIVGLNTATIHRVGSGRCAGGHGPAIGLVEDAPALNVT